MTSFTDASLDSRCGALCPQNSKSTKNKRRNRFPSSALRWMTRRGRAHFPEFKSSRSEEHRPPPLQAALASSILLAFHVFCLCFRVPWTPTEIGSTPFSRCFGLYWFRATLLAFHVSHQQADANDCAVVLSLSTEVFRKCAVYVSPSGQTSSFNRPILTNRSPDLSLALQLRL